MIHSLILQKLPSFSPLSLFKSTSPFMGIDNRNHTNIPDPPIELLMKQMEMYSKLQFLENPHINKMSKLAVAQYCLMELCNTNTTPSYAPNLFAGGLFQEWTD